MKIKMINEYLQYSMNTHAVCTERPETIVSPRQKKKKNDEDILVTFATHRISD